MSTINNKRMTKNYFFCIAMLLITFTYSTTDAHGQNARSGKLAKRQIVGAWKMDMNKSKQRMSEEKRDALNELDAQSRNQIESKYKNRAMIFRADMSFSMMIKGDEVIVGTWKITPNKKRIVVSPERGDKYVYDVLSVNANRLRLKPRVKNESDLLFPEWQLVKK